MTELLQSVSPMGLALVGLGLLLAGVVKGATGLGYSSCALPFLVYVFGLKTAISIVLVPAMATNVAVALGNGHLAATCRAFAPLYVAMLPGIAAGVWLLTRVDTHVAVMVLGLTILVYVAFSLLRPQIVMPPALASSLQIPVGLTNGILTGLTGSQVMPMVPFFLASDLQPKHMVQAINLGVLLASALMLAGMTTTGIADRNIVLASLFAIVPALAGVELGQRLQHYLAPAALRTAILVILAVAGAGLLFR